MIGANGLKAGFAPGRSRASGLYAGFAIEVGHCPQFTGHSAAAELPATRHNGDMSTSLNLIVVEDDPRMRDRFARSFDTDGRIKVLAWASTAREALKALEQHRPDVLLVDLGLPDASGIHVIEHGHRHHPQCDIMVVSVFGDERSVLASIEAGATGYLLKDDSEEDFVARIFELRAGGSPITPIIARRILQRFQSSTPEQSAPSQPLSEREQEVLNLLARGFAYQEIARLLDVSPHTVGTYVKRLYEKLQVHSRGEAVFEGQRMGLLQR